MDSTTNKTFPFLKLFRNFILILAIVVVSGNIGYRLGERKISVALTPEKKLILNSSPPPAQDVDFGQFWDVWQRLEQRYLDKNKLDPQKMVNGAIQGMVSSLGDPYTVFLPPKENTEFKEDLNGMFEGIGAQLGAKDDKIVVIAPLKDHPAEKAGILPGDWIVKVDEVETFGWTVPQAVSKIRGPKGTAVKLTLVHEGKNEPVDVSVTRDKILIKSVEYTTKQLVKPECKEAGADCPKVGYLRLARFGDQTNDEWNKAVFEARSDEKNIKGLILDLRNNPGGYFQSAIHIASEFIRSGAVVLQENSDGTRETYSVTHLGNLLDMPLLVLINKGSASASEIVAGALKDHKRAILIGETSFGKGSVQTPEDLTGGGGLHITTARWITPNGDWIHGKGIKPDIEVKNDNASPSADLQLEKAIEELTK